MDNINRDFKGIWIPKDVWLNSELSAIDKCMLAEIDSLDNEEGCYASNNYFSNFCGVSVSTITRSIKKLTDLGFIETKLIEGRHRIIKMTKGSSQNDEAPSSKRPTNNITNNITKKVLSKDNTTESGFEFGKPKELKLNVYQQCVSIIDSYTSEPKINKLLKEYLDYLLKKSQAENKVFYVNQFKGIINTLIKLVAEGNNAQNVIEQSINKGYVGFYPTNSGRCFTDNIQTPQRKSSPNNRARDKNGNLMEF